jgi:rhodanese-related sulfurtransferase
MQTQDVQAAKQYFAQKVAYTTGPFEVDGMIRRGESVTIVDVRLPRDYAQGYIPGAVNLPQGRWHTLAGVPKDRKAILYCYNQTCKLAAAAAVELASRGIAVVEMEGGFDAWERNGLKVETEAGNGGTGNV